AVKLVAEEGVGTIAAGVAKAYADTILISGHDGGTGASPLSSIKYAGSPWELGLAETQQVLLINGLRERVTLQTDGGLRTGRDVVVAALLGADEFGFGTAALVAVGCKMARQCHLNTCPVGVATQRDDLRQKFIGQPEHVIRFLGGVAEEVREILAQLGFRRLEEIIGRTDLLEQIPDERHPNAGLLDLSQLLAMPSVNGSPLHQTWARNDRPNDVPFDDMLLNDVRDAIEFGTPVRRSYRIRNVDRTVGARVAGEIALRYGQQGLPPETIRLQFTGAAGQSFGAFCTSGLVLTLIGEANDYVGKGMSGGLVAVAPPKDATFATHENTIAGNTLLYGATGGELYIAGRAGERFAVRNSGAEAVVEGVGDHCCEYMTAGLVVVLGETGRNFGAGMSNGLAFVLDERGDFPERYNDELIAIEKVTDPRDIDMLRYKIIRHLEVTGSGRAADVLAQWDHYLPMFWKVEPKSMAKAQ
ncbi:MAG TPA: glutamate synthase-related protein, partial [Dehalococcoidia bacterium]|nr:glutamate synthase-related protein [Dehalococcoidia bacterium]